MAIQVCPRCQRVNPEQAEFCYYDGANLRARGDGAAGYNALAREFVFPSGRRCRTFDELAQGCHDEWTAARQLLQQGVFHQYFGSIGRLDLARAAQEAAAQPDADAGLGTLLSFFPGVQVKAPQLDINPRRLLLGTLLAGEHRRLQLTVTNRGQGVLHGTVTVSEGGNFLKVGNPPVLQCPVQAPREQKVDLILDTRGQPSGQTFGAKLTVVTNGGVAEVPINFDLVAQPFGKAPFQGARTPREMAEKMRAKPKQAVGLLESGEIARWFAGNGWNYPIAGPQIKGVGAVQQFFEAMGLSKPPQVKVTPSELRLACTYPEPARFQLTLQTSAQKWVYAAVSSDSPWLKALTPAVSGPKQANIALEVDPKLASGATMQGQALIAANGGQKLAVRVQVDVRGLPAGHVPPIPVVATPIPVMATPVPVPAAASRPAAVPVPWSPAPAAAQVIPAQVIPVPATPMASAVTIPSAAPFPSAAPILVTPTIVPPSAAPIPVAVTPVPAGAIAAGPAPLPMTPIPLPPMGVAAGRPPAPAWPVAPAVAAPSVGAAPPGSSVSSSFLATVLAVTIAFFLLRLALVPIVDGFLRPSAVRATLTNPRLKGEKFEVREDSPVGATGGWLQLPWSAILVGADGRIPGALFEPAATWDVEQRAFRHYFSTYLVRSFVLWTWWIGGVLGAILVMGRGGSITDLPWGIVAGAMAGLVGSATLACIYLVVEILPHALWAGTLGPSSGAGMVVLWIVFALLAWTAAGLALGCVLAAIPGLNRLALPIQRVVGGLFRLCGMRRLGGFLAPA